MHFPGLELRPLRCNSGTFKSTNTSKGFSGFGIAATTLQQWRTQKYQHFKDYPCLGLRLLLCNSGTLKSTKHAWSRSLCCPFVCVMHMQLCHTHAFIMSYTCIYVMQMHLCHTHAFMSCTCIYVIHMNLCHTYEFMSCTCIYNVMHMRVWHVPFCLPSLSPMAQRLLTLACHSTFASASHVLATLLPFLFFFRRLPLIACRYRVS